MNSRESKTIVLLSFFVSISFIIFISNFSNTYSLDYSNYKFKSDIYSINNNYIENISIDTNIELFKKYFDFNNCYIEVTDNNKVLENNNYIKNGSKTILYDDKSNIIKTYTNIIKGDINNDGIVNDSDLNIFAKYLVDNISLDEIKIKTLDIDNDNKVQLNDLLLLDKAITLGYENLSIDKEEITIRLYEESYIDTTITPNYGVNTNLKWTSSNDEIVTIDEIGRITGINGGEAVIKASTIDGKYIDEVKVTVDNSIILESNSGEGYVDGYKTKVHIDVLNYDTITCKSDNESIATCTIEDDYLVITAHSTGNTNITISGDKYKDVIYNVKCGVPGIGSYNRAGCNMVFTQVVGFFSGNLKDFILESSEPGIVIGSEVGKLTTGADALIIKYGDKYGRTFVKIKGPTTSKVLGEIMIDHSIMYLENEYSFSKVGDVVTTNITGQHLGNLSCTVKKSEQNIASCEIKDNKLIVTALALGQADITVHNTYTYEGGWNGNCGTRNFTLFVQE